MNIWDKYRHQSNQSICMIGILILGTKLCQADGNFTQIEKEELIRIFPHDDREKLKMENIIEEASKDQHPIEYHAERIKKYIGNDNYLFLEFIIAVLYKLAHIDHVYDIREDEQIRKVAAVFGIKKTLYERTQIFFKNKITNYFNAKFRKTTL